jgi:hypothetical protein
MGLYDETAMRGGFTLADPSKKDQKLKLSSADAQQHGQQD